MLALRLKVTFISSLSPTKNKPKNSSTVGLPQTELELLAQARWPPEGYEDCDSVNGKFHSVHVSMLSAYFQCVQRFQALKTPLSPILRETLQQAKFKPGQLPLGQARAGKASKRRALCLPPHVS